jgi:hypothetical protein
MPPTPPGPPPCFPPLGGTPPHPPPAPHPPPTARPAGREARSGKMTPAASPASGKQQQQHQQQQQQQTQTTSPLASRAGPQGHRCASRRPRVAEEPGPAAARAQLTMGKQWPGRTCVLWPCAAPRPAGLARRRAGLVRRRSIAGGVASGHGDVLAHARVTLQDNCDAGSHTGGGIDRGGEGELASKHPSVSNSAHFKLHQGFQCGFGQQIPGVCTGPGARA